MSRRAARRVSLDGELTILTAAEQHQRLCSALAGGKNFDVLLSGVTDLDTAGLQLLLLTKREAGARNLRVTFRDASKAVTEVLAVAQLNEALEYEPPANRAEPEE